MRKLLLLPGFFLMALLAAAQTKEVSGTVKDSKDGTPIEGATIRTSDGRNATVSKADGSFSLRVAESVNQLVVSSVSHQQLVVPITGSVLDIRLVPSTESLSEVVISGYATRTKRANTGSVASISMDEVKAAPVASFDQLLQGAAPGLNVKNGSGQPGRNAEVVIRGRGSINGSVTPLYIVDGVEVRPEDFSTMNQADFETISVLKDAASTAIYGSRGANGVIVITTKKGRAGKVRYSYDGQFGTSTMPDNKLKLMNTPQKIEFEKNIANNPWGWSDQQFDSLAKINTNWYDAVFHAAPTQSHQLSASGGDDKTTFYASVGYLDQQGTAVNTGLTRYTGRLNIAHTDQNVKIGVNMAGGWSKFIGTDEGNSGVGSPLNTVIWALPYETPYTSTGDYTNSIQFPFWINPVEELQRNPQTSWQLKLTGSAFVEYKLPWVKNLTYRLNTGGDFSQFELFNIINNGTQSALQNAAFGQDYRGSGEVSRGLDRRFRYTVTNSLTYKTYLDAAKDHSLTAAVYSEFVRNQGRSFNYTGYGLLLPFPNEAGLVAGTASNGYIPIVGGGFPENSALMSYFSSLDYGFRNRYFVTLTGRTDGSSRLSPENRWTRYGSVGASWILSDEDFFHADFVKLLKLKASIGSVGNQNGIGEFPYLQQYGRGTYSGGGTLQISRLGNNNLTWEKRRTINLGVDYALFNYVVTGSIEVYNSRTNGLYFSPFVPSTSGGSGSILSNNGSMSNKGIEVALGVRIINTKNFKWQVQANYSYNKNTILSLPDHQDLQLVPGGVQALKVGKPLNSFYLVRYAGVDPATGNSLYYTKDGKTKTDVFSTDDLTIVGTSDAPHNGGFTTTFNYKGFELQAFFTYSFGNYIYNNALYNVAYGGYASSGFWVGGLNAWTTPGQVTDFPRIDENTQASTTRFLEKGDFWRLRNLMLSYSLSQAVCNRLKIGGFRIFVQGQNLYSHFSFLGFDPEVSPIQDAHSSSVNGAQYPALRTITTGVNITL
ncbi:MAG TPA: SusC/RagA family TonB-linked outer membrane protein [Chitinophagaceae bacterium]|nr:SusC/RagA family TonB-linked outer membrane protein [Chitinophagaceae bacterium]